MWRENELTEMVQLTLVRSETRLTDVNPVDHFLVEVVVFERVEVLFVV
jgi:hypothetical protein